MVDPMAGHFIGMQRSRSAKFAISLADQYFTADPAVKRVESSIIMKAVKGRYELLIPSGRANGLIGSEIA
jgi:hypothetical protein